MPTVSTRSSRGNVNALSQAPESWDGIQRNNVQETVQTINPAVLYQRAEGTPPQTGMSPGSSHARQALREWIAAMYPRVRQQPPRSQPAGPGLYIPSQTPAQAPPSSQSQVLQQPFSTQTYGSTRPSGLPPMQCCPRSLHPRLCSGDKATPCCRLCWRRLGAGEQSNSSGISVHLVLQKLSDLCRPAVRPLS